MSIHLVTGASGLVGTELAAQLRAAGHEVRTLTTRAGISPDPNTHFWSPDTGVLDPAVLSGVSVVHHLAGASVSEKWTAKHRREILTSRQKGTDLLVDRLRALPAAERPHTVVCASAVGIYPDQAAGNPLLTENDGHGTGFLADVVRQWELATDEFRSLGIRTVQLRIGIVLGQGGALSAMLPLFRAGLGSALGSGKQWMPWIHVEDLGAAFVHASQRETMDGVYNAVGVAPATNRDFSAVLARVLNKPFWAPAPPAFLLRLILGDRSVLVLGSTPASSEKLCATGFVHRYTDLEATLASVVKA